MMFGVENITPKVVVLSGVGFFGLMIALAFVGSVTEAVADKQVSAVYLPIAVAVGYSARFFLFLLKKAGEEIENARGRR